MTGLKAKPVMPQNYFSLYQMTTFSTGPIRKHLLVTENLIFVLGRAENIFGKGENTGHQHFLLFP